MQGQRPKIGESKSITFEVTPELTITFGGGDTEISVLSTPSLIWFLEQAALQFLEPWLEPDSLSVGTHVDIEHLAPTPPGEQVQCTARLIYQDGPVYRFNVEAFAGGDKIASGLHSRRIVRLSQLAKRLRKQ
ncbi:thioesterase family protein [Gimesia sp.]|uniref:thioesterase family protein n=1 Tax=Gimesia sp. TaxID=2024833 RepID=UPI0032EEFF2F